MRKFLIILFVATMATSCNNITNFDDDLEPIIEEKVETEVKNEKLSFCIELPRNNGRAVYSIDDVSYYKVSASKDDFKVNEIAQPGDVVDIEVETEGTYNIKVLGFTEDDIKIANGEVNSVISNKTKFVTVPIIFDTYEDEVEEPKVEEITEPEDTDEEVESEVDEYGENIIELAKFNPISDEDAMKVFKSYIYDEDFVINDVNINKYRIILMHRNKYESNIIHTEVEDESMYNDYFYPNDITIINYIHHFQFIYNSSAIFKTVDGITYKFVSLGNYKYIFASSDGEIFIFGAKDEANIYKSEKLPVNTDVVSYLKDNTNVKRIGSDYYKTDCYMNANRGVVVDTSSDYVIIVDGETHLFSFSDIDSLN